MHGTQKPLKAFTEIFWITNKPIAFENAKELGAAFESKKKLYNLCFENCVDADQETVQKKIGIDLPLDIDPRPNEYFNKLQKFVEKSNENFVTDLKETVKFKAPEIEPDSKAPEGLKE